VSHLGGPRGFRSSVQVASAASSVKTRIAERRARLGVRTRGKPHRSGLGALAVGHWLRYESTTLASTPVPYRCATATRACAEPSAVEDTACGSAVGGPAELGRATQLWSPVYTPAFAKLQAQYFARVHRTTFYRVMERHQPGWLDAALMQIRITRGWHRTDRAGTSLTSTRKPLSPGTLRTSCRGRSRPRDILDSAHRLCSHFPLRGSDPAALQGRASIMPPSRSCVCATLVPARVTTRPADRTAGTRRTAAKPRDRSSPRPR